MSYFYIDLKFDNADVSSAGIKSKRCRKIKISIEIEWISYIKSCDIIMYLSVQNKYIPHS